MRRARRRVYGLPNAGLHGLPGVRRALGLPGGALGLSVGALALAVRVDRPALAWSAISGDGVLEAVGEPPVATGARGASSVTRPVRGKRDRDVVLGVGRQHDLPQPRVPVHPPRARHVAARDRQQECESRAGVDPNRLTEADVESQLVIRSRMGLGHLLELRRERLEPRGFGEVFGLRTGLGEVARGGVVAVRVANGRFVSACRHQVAHFDLVGGGHR